ncbi:RAMP superfamily CRISPR-associated protein [Frankia sp. CiP1_Cm_nod2]|uniref:RAMP superfamily CRISPR-associated protein n=1 Tax=Frankia sp. CiP1_Cm_nod2 TaxID=2897161 RepID=UPI002023ECEB
MPDLDLENGAVPDPLTVIVDITGDWHVGSGYGLPGGIDATIRRDAHGRPYLPGTTLTGLWRDACAQASIALDAEAARHGEANRPWWAWTRALFGHAGTAPLFTVGSAHLPPKAKPRTDRPAIPALGDRGDRWTLIKPGVAIDHRTGRAHDDMLRFVEMAKPATLFATARLVDADSWTREQRRAAATLLLIGASLIDAVGGDRRRGAGAARVLVSKSESVGLADADQADIARKKADSARLRLLDNAFRAVTDFRGQVPAPAEPVVVQGHAPAVVARAAAERWFEVDLTITVDQPVLASTGVSGNMLTGADQLPGTTLLPWVHGALRRLAPQAAADAVTAGELIVTAATPEVAGKRSNPVPLAFQRAKDPADTSGSDSSHHSGAGGANGVQGSKEAQGAKDAKDGDPRNVLNRLRAGQPKAQYKPMRTGYVAPVDAAGAAGPTGGTGPVDAGGSAGADKHAPSATRLLFHQPVLAVAMHNQVEEYSQRPTEDSGLYTVQVIPPRTSGSDDIHTDTRLRAHVRVSQRLHDALATAGPDWPRACLASEDVRLGGKSKSEYGRVRVEVSGVRHRPPRDSIVPVSTNGAQAGTDSVPIGTDGVQRDTFSAYSGAGGVSGGTGGVSGGTSGAPASGTGGAPASGTGGTPDVSKGELFVWLRSDTIVRDSRLRMSADVTDLVRLLQRLGVGVDNLVPVDPGSRGPVPASARTRRISSWHRPSGLPRPTLVALAAGTCLRLGWDGSGADVLARLEITGIGGRTAEGFGQVSFNDPELVAERIELLEAQATAAVTTAVTTEPTAEPAAAAARRRTENPA